MRGLRTRYTGCLICLIMSLNACGQKSEDLSIEGYSSLYQAQFTLETLCSSEIALPSFFEAQLSVSTPALLVRTTANSSQSTLSSIRSSQLAQVDLFPLDSDDSTQFLPSLFANLDLIGQTCLDSSDSRSSLCLMGYQTIQFQKSKHSEIPSISAESA